MSDAVDARLTDITARCPLCVPSTVALPKRAAISVAADLIPSLVAPAMQQLPPTRSNANASASSCSSASFSVGIRIATTSARSSGSSGAEPCPWNTVPFPMPFASNVRRTASTATRLRSVTTTRAAPRPSDATAANSPPPPCICTTVAPGAITRHSASSRVAASSRLWLSRPGLEATAYDRPDTVTARDRQR